MLFWQREKITRVPLYEQGPVADLGLGSASFGVKGRAVAPVSGSLDGENKFREEIEGLIYSKKYPIYEVNSKTALDTIDGLMTQYRALNGKAQSQKAFIADAKSVLTDRGRAIKQHANVLHKEVEVRESQKTAGKLDFNALGPELIDRVTTDPKRWPAYFDEYGPQYDDLDKRQDKIDEIKSDSNPTIHTMPLRRHGLPLVTPSYRRLLHEANKQTSTALAENSYQLNSLVKTGRLLPPKEKRPAQQAAEVTGGALEGLALNGFRALQGVAKAAGKGIWSKSDPNYSPYLRKYHDKRNQLLSNLVWNLDPKQNKNSALMQKCKKILEDSQNEDGLMDSESFAALTNLITEQIAANDQASAQQMKNFNKNINDLNEQAVATAKEQTADSDAMFKWRVLQVALIVSPFMGLSIMGPITSIFEGVFMNAGGIGAGIASLATGQYTGPFGDFCELLHLDEAIKWLLCDMPVLSNVVDIVDTVVSSNLVQGVLGGVVLPLASSALVPIAIASVFSLFRANAEIDYSKKYGDAFKNHEKAMREELDKIAKEAMQTPGKYDEATKMFLPWDIGGFVEKKYKIMQDFYLKSELAEYAIDKFKELKLKGNDKFIAEIIGEDFMKKLQEKKVFDEHGNISNKDLMDFLADSRDSAFYDKIRYFRALERECGTLELERAIERFRNAPESGNWRNKLIDSELELQKEEYILKLADNCGVDRELPAIYEPRVFADSTDANKQARIDDLEKMEKSRQIRAEALAKIEAKIKKEEVKFLNGGPFDSKIKEMFTPPAITAPQSSSSFVKTNGKAI